MEAYSTLLAVSANRKMEVPDCRIVELYEASASSSSALIVKWPETRVELEDLAVVLLGLVCVMVLLLPFSVEGISGTAVRTSMALLEVVDRPDELDAHTWPMGSSGTLVRSAPVPMAGLQPAPSHEPSVSEVYLVR